MQCRAEAGSGISLTYSTVINDRCTTRGKIHRNLSSWYVDAQGFTELSDDLSADRSSPVPPCSPLEQGPPGYPPFPPQPPKYGDADGWCAMFTIKKSSGLSKPTLTAEQHRVPITTEARPNQHRPSCSLGDGRDDGTTAERTPRPLFRNRLD